MFEKRVKQNKALYPLIGLCLFWVIYNHCLLEGALFLSMERISLFILLIYVVLSSGKISFFNTQYNAYRVIRRIAIWQSVLLVYSIFLLLLFGRGTGETIIEAIVNLLVVGLLCFVLFSNAIQSIDSLMQMLLIISLLQCAIILLSLASSSFASFIDNAFNKYEYFDYPVFRNAGYAGGIACITSTGAFKISLGLISCMYFIQKKHKLIWYSLCYLIISFAMTAVARTGLFIWVTGLLIMIYQAFVKGNKGSRKALFIIVVIIVIALWVLFETGITELFPVVFKRLMRFKTMGLYESFFREYYSGETTFIPPLNSRMLLGLGITSGISGDGIMINADGGYIRAYAALGLPMAIINYAVFFFSIVSSIHKLQDNKHKLVGVYFMALFIMGEYKEPFLYSRYMFVVFFLFIFLCEKEYKMHNQ